MVTDYFHNFAYFNQHDFIFLHLQLCLKVLRVGEGGENLTKLPFGTQFYNIWKSSIWKTELATFAKALLTARAFFVSRKSTRNNSIYKAAHILLIDNYSIKVYTFATAIIWMSFLWPTKIAIQSILFFCDSDQMLKRIKSF